MQITLKGLNQTPLGSNSEETLFKNVKKAYL